MGSNPKSCETPKRTGILIPFAFRRTLKLLRTDQKARLFDAVLAYGEEGIEPDFLGADNIGLAIAFEQLREKIDYDGKKYVERVDQNRRNAYVPSWKAYAAKNGIDPDDIAERDIWIDQQIEKADARGRKRPQANGMQSLASNSDGSQTKDKPNKTKPKTDYTKDKGSDRDRGTGEEEELRAIDSRRPANLRPASVLDSDYTGQSEDEFEDKRKSAMAEFAQRIQGLKAATQKWDNPTNTEE